MSFIEKFQRPFLALRGIHGIGLRLRTPRPPAAPLMPPEVLAMDWPPEATTPFGFTLLGMDLHSAVGLDGHMPIGIAMCLMLQGGGPENGDLYDAGPQAMRRHLLVDMHFDASDSRFDQWEEANAAAFSAISNADRQAADSDRIPAGFAYPSMLRHGGWRLAEFYLAAFERMSPPSIKRSFVLVDGLSGEYWGDPAVLAAEEAAAKALEVMTDIAFTWFESRGFSTDRLRLLIEVPGYRALGDYVEEFF